jgi:hypothetical protein
MTLRAVGSNHVGLEENWEALGYPDGAKTSRDRQPKPPCRTLMWPPGVKRQTILLSGSVSAFSCLRCRRPEAWADSISPCRCRRHVLAPHTYCGAIACQAATAQDHWCPWATEKPLGALVPSEAKKGLSGFPSPVSRRFGCGAAHVQQPRPSSGIAEPERTSNQRTGIREARPRCGKAFHDAALQGCQHSLVHLIPAAAREAAGAPAP